GLGVVAFERVIFHEVRLSSSFVKYQWSRRCALNLQLHYDVAACPWRRTGFHFAGTCFGRKGPGGAREVAVLPAPLSPGLQNHRRGEPFKSGGMSYLERAVCGTHPSEGRSLQNRRIS